MDWQFQVGLGTALAFFLFPYAVKDMPAWVTWPGIVVGFLFASWGMMPNHDRIPIGPALLFIASIAGIVASYLWYCDITNAPNQATASQQPDKEAAATNEPLQPDHSPPIGSLRYVIAKMELDIKSDLKKAAGRIEVEIHNDSDRLIKFHAVTAGNINGVALDFNKVQFDGYVNPHQSSFLVSNRISDIPLSEQTGFDTPSITGVYEYDLSYGDARDTWFSRRTSKGVKILNLAPIMRKPKGTVIEKPIRVLLYNEIEE